MVFDAAVVEWLKTKGFLVGRMKIEDWLMSAD
jgi:hypothetical protein